MTTTSATAKPDLPKYCYMRRKKIWLRYKDENNTWVDKKTPYTADQVEYARRLITGVLRAVEAKRSRGESGPDTLREYVKRWAKERATRGVSSADADLAKLEKYVMPHVGDMRLEAFRPRHARDVVRALRSLKDEDGYPELAPRTIHHIFAALYNVFENAMVDELVFGENPVKVKAGELPKKVDADPEWRMQATFAVPEVVELVSNELIPVERRVQYALKALAGQRHGEVAALSWRHLDFTAEPLGRITVAQAWDSIKGALKRTKTEETRYIPLHETLAKILVVWRDVHWPRIYGRVPGLDDFVVPTRNFTCISGHDACESFKRDLLALGLRVEAGKRRDRGGHDLRSWYETRCIEDGADSVLLRRTTHSPPKTISGNYERFSWATICREVAKLRLEVPDEKILTLAEHSLHAESKARARWQNLVTPKGLEPFSKQFPTLSVQRNTRNVHETRPTAVTRERKRSAESPHVKSAVTAGAMLERALRLGDIPKALQIAAELKGGRRG